MSEKDGVCMCLPERDRVDLGEEVVQESQGEPPDRKAPEHPHPKYDQRICRHLAPFAGLGVSGREWLGTSTGALCLGTYGDPIRVGVCAGVVSRTLAMDRQSCPASLRWTVVP